MGRCTKKDENHVKKIKKSLTILYYGEEHLKN